MSDYPSIQIEFTNAFCTRHGEPFRATFPKGVEVAIPRLVTAFSELPDVDAYSEGSAAKFQAAGTEFGPMCCAVDGRVLLAIYRQAKIGKLGICQRCAKGRQGTPYRVKDERGATLIEHLCFECAIGLPSEKGGDVHG